MSQEEKGFYQFEQFRLDPSRRLLLREDEPIPLPPKALATLVALLERQGEVVAKDELLQMVWPDTFISEATLTQNIFRLRKALGEGAGEHRFIVTVPGRGYSFVAAAAWKADEDAPAWKPARTEAPSRPQMPIAVRPPELPVEPPPSTRRSRRRMLLAAGLALLLLASGFLLVSRFTGRKAPPKSPSLRRSVAVWGFHNMSGDKKSAWLSTTLTEMFTVELAVGERLHILSGETVARARLDLGLEDVDDLSPESLARVRNSLGCDAVLLGAYLDLPQQAGRKVRVDLRLVDTATGEVRASATQTRPESELFEVIAELGADLRRSLGAGAPAAGPATRASFPSDREARRLYSEGLRALRRLDNLKARDFLSHAIQREPGFPLAHAALARAWINLGYDANAEREAQEAFERSAALPREERLLIDALRAETAKDWLRAIDIYKTLWTFFPDDLEHGLRLARAQTDAAQGQEALDTLAVLRRLPAPVADDPRIDLAEADAVGSLGESSRQEELAARAAEAGKQQGARLVVARARFLQARAFRSLGRNAEALLRLREAAGLYAKAGDKSGVAGSANSSANLLMDQGDLEGSRREYERALAIHLEIGNQRGRMIALRNLGGIESELGRLARAKQLLTEADALAREIRDRNGEAGILVNLANVLHLEGDLIGAEKKFEECLSLYREIGTPVGEATARANLSAILQDQGDLQEARRQAETALRLYEAASYSRGITYALVRLGSVLADEGRLQEAGATYQKAKDVKGTHISLVAEADSGLALVNRLAGKLEEARKNERAALDMREKSQEKISLGLSRFSLAQIALDAGDPQAAEREAQSAAEQFHALGARDWDGLANGLLARALLAQGKTAPAEQAVRDALQLTDGSQNRRFRLLVLIDSGRVAATAGRVAEARQTLETARGEAVSRGLWIQRLEAELALGEAELRYGDAAAGRRMLQALQRQASMKGFRQIARQANNLLTSRR